jgi:hypothetical protein
MLVGQVRAIFAIPEWIGPVAPLGPLAYIEWFTPPKQSTAGIPLYQVNQSTAMGQFRTSIIPINQIVRGTHLIPKFGKLCNPQWTSSNVLDICNSFYVNTYFRYEDFELFV